MYILYVIATLLAANQATPAPIWCASVAYQDAYSHASASASRDLGQRVNDASASRAQSEVK